jgi:hypothetical protein
MSTIADFRPGETKRFNVTCKINGAAQDITSDTVTVTIKDVKSKTDQEALLQKTADVATQGADGVAMFHLTPTDTKNITPVKAYLDIEWERTNGDKYIIHDQQIEILARVSDGS